MSDVFQALSFSFSITGPIFIVLLLGTLLARIGMINDAFIDAGSRLVFNVTLPTLLFINISTTSIGEVTNLPLVIYGVVATIAVYILLEGLARILISLREERGVIVQGAFRSNMGIIGLAYCVNAYGDAGLVGASLYLGIVTVLYNILAVITLNRSLHKQRSFGDTLKEVLRNPLIIGILLALPLSWKQVAVPGLLLASGNYFAQMTLPLALLCTGGTLSLKALQSHSRDAAIATAGKLLLVPLLITGTGILVGFRGTDLGILFLMSSAPTAAASYIMVRAMGGNATLAANIVALTTLGSLFATSIGIGLLRTVRLV